MILFVLGESCSSSLGQQIKPPKEVDNMNNDYICIYRRQMHTLSYLNLIHVLGNVFADESNIETTSILGPRAA